jgi:hypothetical protein
MAGPIIHLLAAKEWAKGRPELIDCPEYYLGAIAPDAIHARAGTGKDDKQRTHLSNHSRLDLRPIAAYVRARTSAFDLGYVAHVLTDPFWVAAYKNMTGLLKADGHTDPEIYYREMNRAESALIDEGLFALLKKAEPPADHPLLSAEELDIWRGRVLAHRRDLAAEAGENSFITPAFVAAFIARAGAHIGDMMRRLGL